MIRSRSLPAAAGLAVAVAAALALAATLAGVLASPSARAQETCRSRCWDLYGACYKSTSNRQRCQALLQRCLSNCMRDKR